MRVLPQELIAFLHFS